MSRALPPADSIRFPVGAVSVVVERLPSITSNRRRPEPSSKRAHQPGPAGRQHAHPATVSPVRGPTHTQSPARGWMDRGWPRTGDDEPHARLVADPLGPGLVSLVNRHSNPEHHLPRRAGRQRSVSHGGAPCTTTHPRDRSGAAAGSAPRRHCSDRVPHPPWPRRGPAWPPSFPTGRLGFRRNPGLALALDDTHLNYNRGAANRRDSVLRPQTGSPQCRRHTAATVPATSCSHPPRHTAVLPHDGVACSRWLPTPSPAPATEDAAWFTWHWTEPPGWPRHLGAPILRGWGATATAPRLTLALPDPGL